MKKVWFINVIRYTFDFFFFFLVHGMYQFDAGKTRSLLQEN